MHFFLAITSRERLEIVWQSTRSKGTAIKDMQGKKSKEKWAIQVRPHKDYYKLYQKVFKSYK